uniref:Aminotransferase-like plant mobile domain-containing protein n=1 Tax=Fagus sylvatica TaxID=28930 RepID=A0A2N9I180_FAGSY
MASSSSAPVSPPLQPSSGERLEVPPLAPAASTEAMVDAPMVPPPISGESGLAAPSPVSGEAEDPQEGFAAPLLDPWYTSSPLFPPKSVDFSHPVEDWDWTVSGVEPTVDQAWVPGLEEISELLIQKGDLQATPINFDFPLRRFQGLVSLGGPDTEALRELLRRWCPSTHTFFFSWGELTPTLEDEEIAAVLKKHSSTRLSGWPSTFINYKKAPIRRAAFILYWLCKCTFGNFPCYSVNTIFIPLAIRISVGHLFPSCTLILGYIYAARDRSAAWGKLSDLPQKFLDQFPSFRDNLPLVYRWASLKPRDHDLVEALDYEENVLFRPYGDDHPGFTCASVFRKLYGPTPLIRDLKAEDYRSLSYLSTVSPGFLPVLSATGVSFIPYCPQRVQRQFGLDQGIPVGPQETTSCVADLTAFLKSSAFARWGGEGTRVLIPGGHRFGFNTASMGAYWQRLTRSMVDYVIAGRSDKTPMSVHRKPLVSNPYLTPPTQSAISYANSQKLGFAEWDSARGGWVAYTIHLPEGWKEFCQRGASTTALAQGATKSAVAPSKRKTRAGKETLLKKTKVGKESKSTTSVPLAAKESMAAPVEESVEPTVASSRSKRASPAKRAVKKGAASDPPRGQKKVSVSSSTDEEEPSAVPIPSPPKKKKFTAPLFPLGAAGRTRSKSGPKVVRGSGGSGGDTVVVEDSDVAEEDIDAGPPEEDAPSAAAVDQTENLGKSAADSSEIGIESMGEDLSSSSGSLFDSAPDSMPEEQMVSAESTADDEDMPEADDSSVGAAGSMDEDLAIVPHAGYDDDSAVDADVDPISFSLPQPVLTSAAGGFVIPAGHFTSEDSPVVGGALMPEEIHAQGLVESGSVVDLGHDAPLEGTGASAVDVLAGSDHLENIGADDAVHVSEEIDEVGITGEVTVVSPPRRPTIEVGSSIDVSSLSSEVAAFLREFDARAPNPHPEQFFWSFNGPLVPFGDFWVPNDCSPYLSRLSAGHSDFTKGFKLSIGLGGPMLSLLGSVLAAMDESSLEDVTKTPEFLAWRSVIQDLMDVGFDLGFVMERLRQMAQCVFGKRLTDEIKALQHQIALLQDSLAKLTAYQDAMMSTGEVVPRSERGGSFLDSLLD